MSTKLNHKQKQRLARRHMTNEEIKNKVPMFQSEWWSKRNEKIKQKVKKTELNRMNKTK